MQPLAKVDAFRLIRRRHPEWSEHQRRWRFLEDSLEGGNRYRYANYAAMPDAEAHHGNYGAMAGGSSSASIGGYDSATASPIQIGTGQINDRNLIPHLSEMDADSSEIYSLRLARTPVPKHLERVIGRHMGRIYAREIQREGSTAIKEWWSDVDGRGSTVDQWMQDAVAPLLLACGQIDIGFDHPKLPPGVDVRTLRDVKAVGLDRCIATIILPENMVWWELTSGHQYEECIVAERRGVIVRFRHWTAEESTLYGSDGTFIETVPHPFGVVPIRRIFDRRKRRCENIGQPRYEEAAEYQRAIYNGLSEQILGDVLQAHPLLQGPEDFVQGENKITVGPENVLPMKRNSNDGSHEGWSFVDPPQGAAESRRTHLLDFVDAIDRGAALTKPAGVTTSGGVAQSGVSKSFDNQEGNDYLSSVASAIERCELAICHMVLRVLSDGEPTPADIEGLSVVYPRQFDLATGDDLSSAHGNVVAAVQDGGQIPETTKEFAKRMIRAELPGLTDGRLDELYAEIDAAADRKRQDIEQVAEGVQVADYEIDPTAAVVGSIFPS